MITCAAVATACARLGGPASTGRTMPSHVESNRAAVWCFGDNRPTRGGHQQPHVQSTKATSRRHVEEGAQNQFGYAVESDIKEPLKWCGQLALVIAKRSDPASWLIARDHRESK